MMKELLEKHFGKYYQSTKQVVADCSVKDGEFSFNDIKACNSCKTYSPEVEKGCEKVVFTCNSGKNKVETIQLEKFIDNYANLKMIPSGKKCDLLLVGERKIVFCEMTCSRPKYIVPYRMKDGTEKIGKRNTVRGQIENSITLLQSVPEISAEISVKAEKIALFAYREKPEVKKDDFDSQLTSKMKSFDAVGKAFEKEQMFSDMSNGFMFTEVKYPNVYLW